MSEQRNFIIEAEKAQQEKINEERKKTEIAEKDLEQKMKNNFNLLEISDIKEFKEKLEELHIDAYILLGAINNHIQKSQEDERRVYSSPYTPLNIMSIDLSHIFNALTEDQKEELEAIINDILVKKEFVLRKNRN